MRALSKILMQVIPSGKFFLEQINGIDSGIGWNFSQHTMLVSSEA